jgi:hypothetical protein
MSRLDVGIPVPSAGGGGRSPQLGVHRRGLAQCHLPEVRPIRRLIIRLADRVERDTRGALELLAEHEAVRSADRQHPVLERHQRPPGHSRGTRVESHDLRPGRRDHDDNRQ